MSTLNEKNDEIKKLNDSLMNSQIKIFDEIQEINKEIAVIRKNKLRLSEKNNETTEEVNKVIRQNERLVQELDSLKEFIGKKAELEEQLNERVKIHEAEELKIVQELMKVKSELLDAQTYYQEFPVKIFILMMKCNATLVLKKDIDNQHVLEFRYKDKKESILIKDIEDICEHPTKDMKILVKYKNKSKKFLAEKREKIVGRIRDLMQRCVR